MLQKAFVLFLHLETLFALGFCPIQILHLKLGQMRKENSDSEGIDEKIFTFLLPGIE